MNNSLAIVSVVACSALIAIGGCNSKEAAGPAADEGAVPASSLDRVTAGAPIKKTLQLFTEQPGRVVAFEETPILSKLPGYVESVQFDIGDRVSRGKFLSVFMHRSTKINLNRSVVCLGNPKLKSNKRKPLSSPLRPRRTHRTRWLHKRKAGVGRADAEYARWDSELNNASSKLVSKGSVTPKLADETSSQFQSAEAARKEALALIESAKAASERPKRTC